MLGIIIAGYSCGINAEFVLALKNRLEMPKDTDKNQH